MTEQQDGIDERILPLAEALDMCSQHLFPNKRNTDATKVRSFFVDQCMRGGIKVGFFGHQGRWTIIKSVYWGDSIRAEKWLNTGQYDSPLSAVDRFMRGRRTTTCDLYVRKEQFEACLNTPAENEAMPTGFPGRPTKGKEPIWNKYIERKESGARCQVKEQESKWLLAWYKKTYPKADQPSLDTIRRLLTPEYRNISQ